MIRIEIVSDLVCPWCFIGLRRLDAAIAAIRRDIPDFDCVKHWRPFFLNPDSPPEGEPYLPFLIKKFGGIEQVQGLFARIREAGAAYGVDYHFEKIQVRANTLNAHRLIHWVQQKGDAQSLVERLFVAQFQRGENLSDIGTLVRLAGECGHAVGEVETYLRSGADTAVVQDMEREFREAGVRAVPTFIVDRKLMVAGAEDPLILANAIRQQLSVAN